MATLLEHGEFWRIIIDPPPEIATIIEKIVDTRERFRIQGELREYVLKKLKEKYPNLFFPEPQILHIFLFQGGMLPQGQYRFEIILPLD